MAGQLSKTIQIKETLHFNKKYSISILNKREINTFTVTQFTVLLFRKLTFICTVAVL